MWHFSPMQKCIIKQQARRRGKSCRRHVIKRLRLEKKSPSGGATRFLDAASRLCAVSCEEAVARRDMHGAMLACLNERHPLSIRRYVERIAISVTRHVHCGSYSEYSELSDTDGELGGDSRSKLFRSTTVASPMILLSYLWWLGESVARFCWSNTLRSWSSQGGCRFRHLSLIMLA